MSELLVKKLLAQRESNFELLPGKFIRLRRPAEVEMVSLRGGITIERLKQIAVGWTGFTEADLLGPAEGASDPVSFDADVFGVWLSDRGEEFAKVAAEVQRLVIAHMDAKKEAAKN